MSHFTVLVIGDDVDAALAPFQENNMGDCPKEYLTFHDQEDEYRKEYDTEGAEMVRLEDGSLVLPWDERFRVPGSIGSGTNTHKVPSHLKVEQVPHKEHFATFEEFVKEWHGREARDPEKNRFGYWENPSAKWDWYVIGGRWSNKLITKRGVARDSCRIGDLDLEAMRRAAERRAMPLFDRLMGILAGRPIPSWKETREKHGDGNIEAARKEYHALPSVQEINADEQLRDATFMCEDLRTEFSNGDREAYRIKVREHAFGTHAVLHDGKWHERGEMGWFGCVRNEKGETTWQAEFNKLLESLAPDTVITVVDCHI